MYKKLFDLIFETNNKVVKYTMIILFGILTVLFLSSVLIKSLIISYKQYLFTNYTQPFGSIYVKIKKSDQKMFKDVKTEFKNSLTFHKSDYTVKLEDGKQKLTLIIWQKQNGYNTILKNILPQDTVYINKKPLKLSNLIETGMIYYEPMLFLNTKTAKDLNLTKKPNYISLHTSFNLEEIQLYKQMLRKFLIAHNAEFYKIHDVFSDNKEIIEILKSFEKMYTKISISIFIVMVLIMLTSLDIFYKLKSKAISLLNILGLQQHTISLFFALSGAVILYLALFFALILYYLISPFLSDYSMILPDIKTYMFVPAGMFFIFYLYFEIKQSWRK